MRPILLQGHVRSLTQIKYNREGDLLFSVSKDNVVNCWYSHNGERLGTYNGHQGSIWTVEVDRKSRLLFTGSADNTARVWDVQTGRLLHTWTFNTAVKRVALSEDDAYVLMVTEKRMGFPSTITVYPVNHEEPTQQTTEPTLVILPQGSKATVAAWGSLSRYIVAAHEDGSVSQYDFPSGDVLKQMPIHEATVTDMQLSADRTYFVLSSKDKTATLVDSATLNPLKKYVTDTPLNSAALTPKIQDFVILGGGQEAMNVTTTSARQGKFECRFHHMVLQDECGRVRGHFGPINTIAVHPDGTSFSSGGEDGYVRVHHFDHDYFRFKV